MALSITGGKWRMANHLAHLDRELLDIAAGRNDRLIVEMPPRHGKALKVDTPIPTPDGWTEIGQLKPGDRVFDETGSVCKVVAVSPVWKDRPVYSVRTDDGDEVVADAEHQWLVRLCRKRPVFKLKTTKQLQSRASDRAPMITAAKPLSLPVATLPIDPYVLGVWLGDGRCDSSSITTADSDIVEELERIEGRVDRYASYGGKAVAVRVGPHRREGARVAETLQSRLRSLGVLGNKHIPMSYMRASADQRLSLLQGLIDTDGFVAKDGQVEFCNKNETLAEQVKELVATLGGKASIVVGRATIEGRDCGVKYRVMFYLGNAARMERKAVRCRDSLRGNRRYITVKPAGVADTVCIQVDSPSRLFLCGRSMLPTHNSELTSKYFPSWYLGTFPQNHVILTSATHTLAKRFSRAGRKVLREFGQQHFGVSLSGESQSVELWETEQGGSLRAAGVGGDIMGQGANVLIIDDFFKNIEEALSPTVREKLVEWFLSTSSTRLAPDGAIIMVATRWHNEDLIGKALKDADLGGESWRRVRFPAIAGHDGDALNRKPGEALWPSQWPIEKLETRQRQYEVSGYPWMWSALYQQEPPEVLDSTWPPELFRGVGFDHWPDPSKIQFTVVTLDPSLGKTDKADFSAYTILKLDTEGVMWIDADLERRDPVRIVRAGFDIVAEHQPVTLGVEVNGFQEALAPIFDYEGRQRGFGVPFHGIQNNTNKRQRITAGLSPWLHNRKLRFRNNSPGVALLLEQLKGFPGHKHDDGCDSLEMAIRLAQGVHSGAVLV